ncbi:hypothetical protein YPPY66_1496, partial [Yersinia pestis PY-66]
MFSSHWRADGV